MYQVNEFIYMQNTPEKLPLHKISLDNYHLNYRLIINVTCILVCVSFSLFIGWIIYQANTGGSNVFFDLVRTIPYGDKIGHFCLFGLLTTMGLLASRLAHFSFRNIRIYYAVLVVSIFVLVEEISQAFISTRTFDLSDLLADALGITLCSFITIKLFTRYTYS